MNSILAKTKNFLISHKLQFLVVGIIFVVFNFALLINGAFPYGDKTLLISDSFAQTGVIFEHIFDFFAGKTSLFYNAKLGGGAEILSMLLYMVLNPFYLIVLPFGKANIYKSFNFVVFAMLVFVAMVAMWFVKKHFTSIKKSVWVLLSLAYTFSACMVLHLSLISWLIFPAIILIVFDRFTELEKNGKFLGFALSVFWLVVSGFVIGVAANILLLIIFVLHIFLTKEKEIQKEIFVKLLLSYVIAVLLSVCVMLPALLAILGTDRAGSLFSAVFRTEFSSGIMHKLACLSLDVLFIVFATYYLAKTAKKSKEFMFWLVSFAIVLIPSIFDASLELMFGGYYSGFPARLQFVTTALLFVMSCKLFNEHDILDKSENEEKSSKLFFGLYIFMIVLFAIAILFFAGFQIKKVALSIKNPIETSTKLYKAIALISVILVILFLTAFLGKTRKVLSKKIFRFTTYLIIIFTTFFNVVLFSVETSTDLADMASIESLLGEEEINGKIKISNCDVDSVVLHNKIYKQGSLNYFSSTISAENTAISKLGYFNSLVMTATDGGTIIADSLVGLRYYVTAKEQNRPYLKLVKKEDKFYIYENTLATTGALVLEKEIEFDEDDILKSFSNIASVLGITEQLFRDVSVKVEKVEGIDEMYAKNVYKCTATAPENGILYLKNICLNEQADQSLQKTIAKKVNSNNIYSCEMFSSGQTDVGYANMGEEIVAYLTDVEDIDDIKFTFLNYGAAEKLCQKLIERQAEFEYTKNGYRINGNSNGERNLVVFMSNIKGMQYCLNDKEVKAESMLGGFVCLNLNDGNFELSASYKCPYILVWVVTVIICLVLLVAAILVYKFTGFKHIKNLTRYLFLSLAAIMLSVFVFFGIVLTFFKLIL